MRPCRAVQPKKEKAALPALPSTSEETVTVGGVEMAGPVRHICSPRDPTQLKASFLELNGTP